MAIVVLGAAFFLILVLTLLVNAVFLVVYCRRRRLKTTGHYTLLVALAFVDVFAGGIWTGISAAAASFDWEPDGELCRLQSYFFTFTQSLTAFILAAVSLERLLLMLKPSRHRMVFVPKVTTFLIFSLVVFCGVVSSIHLYGYIPTSWHDTEKQCRAEFTESVKTLDMTFCFDYAIPYMVIALPAFIGAFVKYYIARKNPSMYGEIVLETNPYAPSDSYSSRLAKMKSKFGGGKDKAKRKKKVPGKKSSLGKRSYSKQGYTEMEHWDSDIDGWEEQMGIDNARLRTHALPRPEYTLLMTSALVTLVTALLWFPWIVVRFVLTNTPRDPAPDWMIVVAMLCCHSSTFVKPILYFALNAFYRSAWFKTFGCFRKRNRKDKPQKPNDSSGAESYENPTVAE